MSKSRYASDIDVFSIAIVLFWIVYFALKIIAIPVLIINIVWLVQAAQMNTVGHFDFLWFIISLATLIFL